MKFVYETMKFGYETMSQFYRQGKLEVLGEKSDPVPHFQPQISHRMARN